MRGCCLFFAMLNAAGLVLGVLVTLSDLIYPPATPTVTLIGSAIFLILFLLWFLSQLPGTSR